MYRGKFNKPKKPISKKSGILLASLVLILALTVGATVAFLIDDSNTVVNTFDPSQVSCTITETFDGSKKTNVQVKSTSDIDAFIRAEIVVNWVKAGTDKIVPVVPEGYSYTLTLNETDWSAQDGYCYYKEKVAPGASTEPLVTLAEPVYPSGVTIADAPYHLQVEIIAEAIQAEPNTVASSVWGYAPAG